MVENSQIVVPVLRPIGEGVAGIATAGSAGADKIADAIGGQGIKVIIQVAFMGASPADLAAVCLAETAIPAFPVWNYTAVDTYRIYRQRDSRDERIK